MMYEATRDDLNDAIALMDEMKEKGYDVSLTDILIANLSKTLQEAIENVEKSLYDVAVNISYLQ